MRTLTAPRVRMIRRLVLDDRCPAAVNGVRHRFKFTNHYDGSDWYHCKRCGKQRGYAVTP